MWRSRHQPIAIGCWIASRHHQTEDHAALAGGQVELMAVSDVATAVDDDIGMGSNMPTSFSPVGTVSPTRTRRSLWVMMRSINGR
ncbi:hypothetical protein J2Z31_002647 [Sinorhizobium kostiense]|uniref:Uncharacterized protein n=1 Tax=Sinorhizobium kostiense TaxID=76747 RepID=A0ABS4QZS1_9HYPH|nr:hypothetical protein [Sinorhizobium kostiense]